MRLLTSDDEQLPSGAQVRRAGATEAAGERAATLEVIFNQLRKLKHKRGRYALGIYFLNAILCFDLNCTGMPLSASPRPPTFFQEKGEKNSAIK